MESTVEIVIAPWPAIPANREMLTDDPLSFEDKEQASGIPIPRSRSHSSIRRSSILPSVAASDQIRPHAPSRVSTSNSKSDQHTGITRAISRQSFVGHLSTTLDTLVANHSRPTISSYTKQRPVTSTGRRASIIGFGRSITPSPSPYVDVTRTAKPISSAQHNLIRPSTSLGMTPTHAVIPRDLPQRSPSVNTFYPKTPHIYRLSSAEDFSQKR
jgi:hypothetical protein